MSSFLQIFFALQLLHTGYAVADYTWWHGFYECKKRFVNFMKEADELIKENKKAYQAPVFPGASGSTQKPPEVFGKPK